MTPGLRVWLIALTATWTVVGMLVILHVLVGDALVLRGLEVAGHVIK